MSASGQRSDTLIHSTVSGNPASSGPGINNEEGALILRGSIVAGNAADDGVKRFGCRGAWSAAPGSAS